MEIKIKRLEKFEEYTLSRFEWVNLFGQKKEMVLVEPPVNKNNTSLTALDTGIVKLFLKHDVLEKRFTPVVAKTIGHPRFAIIPFVEDLNNKKNIFIRYESVFRYVMYLGVLSNHAVHPNKNLFQELVSDLSSEIMSKRKNYLLIK